MPTCYCIQQQPMDWVSTLRRISTTRLEELTLHQTRTASSTCSSVECWLASSRLAVQAWKNLRIVLTPSSSAMTPSPTTFGIPKFLLSLTIISPTRNIWSPLRVNWNTSWVNWSVYYSIQTTNRKWYMAYRIAEILMTLSDLQCHLPTASFFRCEFCTVVRQLTTFQLA